MRKSTVQHRALTRLFRLHLSTKSWKKLLVVQFVIVKITGFPIQTWKILNASGLLGMAKLSLYESTELGQLLTVKVGNSMTQLRHGWLIKQSGKSLTKQSGETMTNCSKQYVGKRAQRQMHGSELFSRSHLNSMD